MHKPKENISSKTPLGGIEPHTELLRAPSPSQLVYKVMKTEDFLKSVSGSYFHFNRVDKYKDFPGADSHDGEQLSKEFAS